MSIKEILENLASAADDDLQETMKDGKASSVAIARFKAGVNPFASNDSKAWDSPGAIQGGKALVDSVGDKGAAAIQGTSYIGGALLPIAPVVKAGKAAWGAIKGAKPAAQTAKVLTVGEDILKPMDGAKALPKARPGLAQEAAAGLQRGASQKPGMVLENYYGVGKKNLESTADKALETLDPIVREEGLAIRKAVEPELPKRFGGLDEWLGNTKLNADQIAEIRRNPDLLFAYESAKKKLPYASTPSGPKTGRGGVVLKPNSGKWGE